MTEKLCDWSQNGQQNMADYHQNEWGFAVFDEQKTFEFLILEMMQAGLSWQTVLNKREGFKRAFANYDLNQIAAFTNNDVERLMQDEGIIRHRKKIEAVISNAKLLLNLKATQNFNLNHYLWSFFDNKPLVMNYKTQQDMRPTSEISKQISKKLKKLGFKFVGPTIIQSLLEALGMINSHLELCPLKDKCQKYFYKNYTL